MYIVYRIVGNYSLLKQWSYLKALVPNHCPGALVVEFILDSVGEGEGEGLCVHDGTECVTVDGVVSGTLCLVEGPGASDVLVHTVGGRVPGAKGCPTHQQHQHNSTLWKS